MMTRERLQELFEYRDGYLYRKVRTARRTRIGERVGSLSGSGYLYASVDGKSYRVHRMIYLYHYGVLPNQLDHIDRDKTNNKVENLRPTTNQLNRANAVSNGCIGSVFKGTYRGRAPGRWLAQIRVAGELLHLGTFKCEGVAAMIYNEAALKHFGDFACLNVSPLNQTM